MKRAALPIAAIAIGLLPLLGVAQMEQKQQPQQQQQQQGAQQGRQDAKIPVVILAPVQFAADEKLGNGCWVRFYDQTNFGGDQLTLIGPVDMPDMESPGTDYWGGLDSAIVGPNARVTVYDGENYRDRTATLKAGQRIADLGDAKLGLFEDIESVRVACTS